MRWPTCLGRARSPFERLGDSVVRNLPCLSRPNALNAVMIQRTTAYATLHESSSLKSMPPTITGRPSSQGATAIPTNHNSGQRPRASPASPPLRPLLSSAIYGRHSIETKGGRTRRRTHAAVSRPFRTGADFELDFRSISLGVAVSIDENSHFGGWVVKNASTMVHSVGRMVSLECIHTYGIS